MKQEIQPEFISGCSTAELLSILKEDGFDLAAYKEVTKTLLTRHKEELAMEIKSKILNYYESFKRNLDPGAKSEIANGHALDVLLNIKEYSKNYNEEKWNGDIIPWLLQIARKKIHLDFNKEISLEFSNDLDRKRKNVYGDDETDEKNSNFEKLNLKLINSYLTEKYPRKTDRQIIISYYMYYDREKKSHHIPKELIEEFRALGFSDNYRYKKIERFKKRILKALGSTIKKWKNT